MWCKQRENVYKAATATQLRRQDAVAGCGKRLRNEMETKQTTRTRTRAFAERTVPAKHLFASERVRVRWNEPEHLEAGRKRRRPTERQRGSERERAWERGRERE